jgi:hypothetical protein
MNGVTPSNSSAIGCAERQRATDQIDRDRPPSDVAAPQQRAPAVGGHLRDRMQHHRGRQRQDGKQHADQDQAAGHAEQAGQERGRDHQQSKCRYQQRRHWNPPPVFLPCL